MIRARGAAMTPADRARVVVAFGFPLGAIGHFAWLIWHGDAFYHGPAPAWAVWFWYALCAVDFVVFWLLLARPRVGLLAGLATMATTLWVNWTQFPTFEFQFNWVLLALSGFGAALLLMTPWMWARSRWTLSRPSSAHSAG